MPDLETSLTYCTYCPKLCRHTCPVSTVEPREPLIPQQKMSTMRRLRVLDAPRTFDETEALYGCTGCMACTEACAHSIEVGPALFRGRDEAVREGRGHPALADLPARFRARMETAAGELRAAVPAARRATEAQVAFLPGCEAPARAATLLGLADRVGAEHVKVAEVSSPCAGYPLYAAGQHDAFRLHAERFANEVRGHATLVVHCAPCAWLLKHEYRRFGVPLAPKIEHTVELLAPFTERLPVARTRAAAFYHDACYLGRGQGLYDPPRRLAAKAVEDLKEFSRARGESECCGAGGLLPETMPAVADAIAERRLEEVREAPEAARTVVTGCGTCARQLARDGVEAIDLLDLLAEATEPG